MDHSKHIRLTEPELTPEILEGATVYGADEEKIGTISHSFGTGLMSTVVIDVGGFLGIGTKPVSVSASQLSFMRNESMDVHALTAWTKEELKAMPEYEP